ncbi:hypothetical protein [Psychromonas aquimarina]|uniref:hypothetical protein n=1 Tax=Psychromonas aquimarina TaxID=444919 RepID=UPI00041723C7|nr:hypothetical protein [Psychromonas aquimarina]
MKKSLLVLALASVVCTSATASDQAYAEFNRTVEPVRSIVITNASGEIAFGDESFNSQRAAMVRVVSNASAQESLSIETLRVSPNLSGLENKIVYSVGDNQGLHSGDTFMLPVGRDFDFYTKVEEHKRNVPAGDAQVHTVIKINAPTFNG